MSTHHYLRVLELIESLGFKYIKLDKSTYRLNNRINLIFRYSKLLQSAVPHYWFGIQREKFESYPAENLFLLLICGSEQHVLVIPATYFKELLRNVNTATDDNWKFNIYNHDNTFQLWVTGKPLQNIHKFLNNYNQLKTTVGDQEAINQETNKLVEAGSTIEDKIKRLDGVHGNLIHDKVIDMIRQIGEWMKYDPVVNYKIRPDISYIIEIAWLLDDTLQIAIDVQLNESMTETKERLILAKRFGARKCIIISNLSCKEKLKDVFRYENEIKHWLEIWSLEKIYNMFVNGREFFMNFNLFDKHKYHEDIAEIV